MIRKIIIGISGLDPKQLDVFTASLDPGVLKLISDPDIKLSDPQLLGLRDQLTSLQASTSYALSLFHTMFNIINTTLLIWFSSVIAKLVTKIIPKKKTDEEFQLRYISTNLLSASELAIPEAKKEIDDYIIRTRSMFDMVRELYYEKQESNFEKTYARILKYENISDRVELEIATFLNNVSEGRLSDESKHQIRQMIRMTSEVESIADSCHNIANTIKRRRDAKVVLTDEMTAHVEHMFGLAYKHLEVMANLITKNSHNTADLPKSGIRN
jgi:phosphate:Na+ symporter